MTCGLDLYNRFEFVNKFSFGETWGAVWSGGARYLTNVTTGPIVGLKVGLWFTVFMVWDVAIKIQQHWNQFYQFKLNITKINCRFNKTICRSCVPWSSDLDWTLCLGRGSTEAQPCFLSCAPLSIKQESDTQENWFLQKLHKTGDIDVACQLKVNSHQAQSEFMYRIKHFNLVVVEFLR